MGFKKWKKGNKKTLGRVGLKIFQAGQNSEFHPWRLWNTGEPGPDRPVRRGCPGRAGRHRGAPPEQALWRRRRRPCCETVGSSSGQDLQAF